MCLSVSMVYTMYLPESLNLIVCLGSFRDHKGRKQLNFYYNKIFLRYLLKLIMVFIIHHNICSIPIQGNLPIGNILR